LTYVYNYNHIYIYLFIAMNTIVQKSLTAWFITALVLSTWVFDLVLWVFVRTDLNGTPTWQCGYGFGYDSGYWYGYDTVTCPPAWWSTNIPSGSKYVFVPIDTSTQSPSSSTTTSPTTSSPTTTTMSTGSSNNPTKPSTTPTKPSNPYGSNYVNWDDNLSWQGRGNGALDSGLSNNGTIANNWLVNNNAWVTTTQPTIPRRLPATWV